MDIYGISNYYLENKQNKEIHILQFIHLDVSIFCKVPIKIKQMTSLINKFSKITINVIIFLIPKTPSLVFIEVDSIVLIPIPIEIWLFFLMKFTVTIG